MAKQRRVLRLWGDYLGDQIPSNDVFREFYLDVIKSSDIYHYGVAYEVFDILTNGAFDLQVADSWNARGISVGENAHLKAVAAA